MGDYNQQVGAEEEGDNLTEHNKKVRVIVYWSQLGFPAPNSLAKVLTICFRIGELHMTRIGRSRYRVCTSIWPHTRLC
jgi:hypothetical protein